MPGFEPGASYMQSMRSTTELHPLLGQCLNPELPSDDPLHNVQKEKAANGLPTARLELAIFGLGDRRLIH